MEPEFLEFDEVIELHERSLAEYGGSSGLRDENLVRSAVAQPRNDFYYGGADLFGIAAAYAFHIAQARRSSMATNAPASPLRRRFSNSTA